MADSLSRTGLSDLGRTSRVGALDQRQVRNALAQLVIVGVFATLAAVAVVVLLTARSVVVAVVAGGALTALTLRISGNPRLLCLYGLVLAAPLDLSKRFMQIPHMGGASAVRFEVIDVFLVTLLAFIARDVLLGYRSTRSLRIPPVCLFWVALISLGLIPLAFGPFRTLAALEMLRMFKSLVLFLVVANEVVRRKQIYHLVMALIIGVAIEGFFGMAELLRGEQLGLSFLGEATQETIAAASDATLQTGEFVHRVSGLIGHANLLSVFLALVMPIGIALLVTQIDLRIRILIAATTVLGVALLVATLSRTGWVVFGIAAFLVLTLGAIQPGRHRRYPLRRLLVLLVMGLVLLAFSGPILQRLYQSDEGAINIRLEYLETAWSMIKDKPILGHGLNAYIYQMAPYTKYASPEGLQMAFGDDWPVVHNNYAIVWAEQGTVGFILFLALAVHVLWVAFRNFRVKDEVLFAINVGCLSGLVAMMIDWLASFSLRTLPLTKMFWLVVGLVCAIDYWWRLNGDRRLAIRAVSGNEADQETAGSVVV